MDEQPCLKERWVKIFNLIHTFILRDTTIVCPFVLFLLAIVLSVLHRYTDSDYLSTSSYKAIGDICGF